MTMSPLLARQTSNAIDKLVKAQTHVVLFSGPEGSGKGFAARYFAARILGRDNTDLLLNHPYFRHLKPAEGAMSIDRIRELQKFLRLKTLGNGTIRRIAVLEDAHLMTTEAQNALLKSLEEPPSDTIIILTAPTSLKLKSTIYSRVQNVPVLPIPKESAMKYFTDDFSESETEKAYLMSSGHIGLMHALLHSKEHVLVESIRQAKQILSGSLFERLTSVDELSKQKESLPTLLTSFKIISVTALRQAGQKGSIQEAKRWHRVLDTVHRGQASLVHNPNPKLLLTHIFLEV